jgi:hypothetical protein
MSYRVDDIIDEKIFLLQEEKYKLRIFSVELLVRISSEYGVEETLQDIRSITGVTVVTALDSLFRSTGGTGAGTYMSHIRIKFHPQKDSTTAKAYLKDALLPVIRGSEIPGCTVIRVVSLPQKVT